MTLDRGACPTVAPPALPCFVGMEMQKESVVPECNQAR